MTEPKNSAKKLHAPNEWAHAFTLRINEVSDRLRFPRNELARQVKEMGLDIAYSTVSNIFAANTRPSFEAVAYIAKVLCVPLDHLAWGSVEADPAPRPNDDERMLLRIYRHQVAKKGLTLEDAIDALTRK